MDRRSFKINILGTCGEARLGYISTKHGDISTPCFMPVGTRASVKAMRNDTLISCGAEIILGNTYHLCLRPGLKKIEQLGGLHKMMNWDRPILTDSGGFQVMSLAGLRKINENGVEFASHIDGARISFTPENVVDAQYILGSTISMVLDQCIAYPASYEDAKAAMELSMRWAARAKRVYTSRDGYALFGIVQGSVYDDLRERSAKLLQEIDFDGYAVGGLAVGEGHEMMIKVLEKSTVNLDYAKPRYLMGVGKPVDIFEAVKRGIDMFDCVLPTRSGRNAQAFTRIGPINLRNAKYATDTGKLDPCCSCYTCQNHTKAYLHHLCTVGEMLGAILLTEHNIMYYQDMMRAIRELIKNKKINECDFSALSEYMINNRENSI